ncbi:MAG TPA: hypothetical protein VFE78_29020 [Gemmataceae bacterium]|jgi:hypothetical protein|nr:hypothetical protein [Gemmataceae bacterium]
MLRSLVCAAFALVICAVAVLAGEYKGKVKSVDPDKNTITVTVGDDDKTFKVTDDTKIVRGKGDKTKDVKDGLKNEKAWGRKPNVTITTEGEGKKEKVKEIRITGGGKKKKDQQ